MRVTSSTSIPTQPDSEDTDVQPLKRGAKSDAVKAAQNQLLDAGYSLTRYGADGQFGGETAAALARFQQATGVPQSGQFDAATFAALQRAPAVTPDYDALFADGTLNAVMAVGYDETGWHEVEQAKVLQGLAQRGFTHVTEAQRQQLGLDAEGRYLTRQLEVDGRDVTVVLELVTPDTKDAKGRFATALRHDELVLYGGHGRYGSGPDFDDIHSPDGNFVIGAPFEAGHVTLGPNDLSAAPLTKDYQLMFFDGCNTYRYLDDLRARTPGKTSANLDVIGSTTELYWDATARNLLTTLDAVTSQADLLSLRKKLDAANELPHAFVGDGFDDNVR